MQSKPRASVILSIYQQARFLPWVLESLRLQQVSAPWELIICDDGSAEDMLDYVKDFSRSVPFEIRYLWQSDRGFRLSRSRNNGIACARGDVLIFMDGDVLAGEHFVHSHVAEHDGSRKLLVGSRSYLFLEQLRKGAEGTNGLSPLTALQKGLRTHLFTTPFQEARLRSAAPWSAICGCNFSVWNDPDLRFDEGFVGWGLEDYELALRLHTRMGYRLCSNTSNMVYHLEESPIARFHPCRPRDPASIGRYIDNVNRVETTYPDLAFPDLWTTLASFCFDPTGRSWRLREHPASARELEETIVFARDWVLETQPHAVSVHS